MSERQLLALVSAIMALTALAIDMMLPAFDEIRDAFELRDGSADVGRIITVFFFGLAAGQLFYGPLADRFGRKPTLYLGVGIYLIGALGSAVAPSFGLMLVSRFVWGLGAAGSRVVAIAIVRDRFAGDRMAQAMSQVMAVFILVPILAPTIGAGVLVVVPWQGVFITCGLLAVAVVLWSLRLSETLDPADRRPLSVRTTWSGLVEVVRTPVTAGYTLASVFLQAVFTAYLASSEVIISDVYGWGDRFPLVFGVVAILFAVGSVINGRLVGLMGADAVVVRVLAAILPLTLLTVVVTAASGGRPPFLVFMPLIGVTLASFMFLLPDLNAAAMEPVGHIAGTASAVTGAARIALGALLGGLIGGAVTDSVTPFAVGVGVMVWCTGATVMFVRHRYLQRPQESDALHRADAHLS